MTLKHRALIALALCGALVACSGEGDSELRGGGPTATAPAGASASGSPSASTSASSLPPELEGTWRAEQTKKDIARNLRAHGFGKWVPRFFEAEDTWAKDIWEYDFYGDNLTGRWMNPDGTWHAGINAEVEVDGNRLRTFDREFLTTDFWRWSVDGDQLRLEWLGSKGAKTIKGIPVEAFVRAYYTPAFTRVA